MARRRTCRPPVRIDDPVRVPVPRETYDGVCIALHDAGVYDRDPGRYPGLPGDAVELGEVVLVVEAGG